MNVPPWDRKLRHDTLLSQQHLSHHDHIWVHSQLCLILDDTDSPSCFCNSTPCAKRGFVILTDVEQHIDIHLLDKNFISPHPANDSSPLFLYLIPIPIHPGINIIDWCSGTAFFHPAQGDYIHIPSINLAIDQHHINTYHLTEQDEYSCSPDKSPYSFPLDNNMDEPSTPITSVTTIFRSVPPLWGLCRLAMGGAGIIPGGLGDVDDLSPRLPAHLWDVHRATLGHVTTCKI